MATKSKHGTCLYEYNGLTFKQSYFSDGWVLRNSGDGWKFRARVKEGVSVEQVAGAQRAKELTIGQRRPCFCAFRSLLHSLVSFKMRHRVYTCIQLMPNDPDGCYSTCADDWSIELTLEECVSLCAAYVAMMEETKA